MTDSERQLRAAFYAAFEVRGTEMSIAAVARLSKVNAIAPDVEADAAIARFDMLTTQDQAEARERVRARNESERLCCRLGLTDKQLAAAAAAIRASYVTDGSLGV